MIHMYSILIRTVETLHKTASVVFISFLAMCKFYLQCVYLLIDKEELKGKQTMGYLLFLWLYFQHKWLGNI